MRPVTTIKAGRLWVILQTATEIGNQFIHRIHVHLFPSGGPACFLFSKTS